MDPDRLDLSALDPSREADRWEGLVKAVLARGARPAPASRVLVAIAASWRPMLAIAAALVALAWAPALLAGAGRPAAAAGAADPVLSTTSWMLQDEAPATAEAIAAMGADRAAR